MLLMPLPSFNIIWWHHRCFWLDSSMEFTPICGPWVDWCFFHDLYIYTLLFCRCSCNEIIVFVIALLPALFTHVLVPTAFQIFCACLKYSPIHCLPTIICFMFNVNVWCAYYKTIVFIYLLCVWFSTLYVLLIELDW